MAKDRFSKQKPIYWNKEFRTTGSKLRPEVSVKKNKEFRTKEQTHNLSHVYNSYKHRMNDWEKEFIASLVTSPYILSVKQKNKFREIAKKYYLLFPEELNFDNFIGPLV